MDFLFPVIFVLFFSYIFKQELLNSYKISIQSFFVQESTGRSNEDIDPEKEKVKALKGISQKGGL